MQLKQVREELAQLQSQVARQAQQVDALFEVAKNHPMTPDAASSQSAAPVNEVEIEPQPSILPFLKQVAICLLVVGLSHWMLLFVYDASPLALRIWTIVLPALPGFILATQTRRGWFFQLIASVFVGLSSVAVMLYITASIDQVPFLPTNARDWKEAFEYAAAICLSFFTGFLILKQRLKIKSDLNRRISLSVLLEKDKNGEFQIAEISKQVNSLITNFAPIVSTGMALYSGLKAFTGS